MTVPEVTALEAADLIEEGALLLDVRNDDEWAAGHAPDAQYLTLHELPGRLDELPTDRQIVTVCRVGNRSAQATEFLISRGFDVVNLAGGMRAWAAVGLDVITDSGSFGEVI